MGRRRAFRPAVAGLEERVALSQVAGSAPMVRPARTLTGIPATTPTPVNGYYQMAGHAPYEWYFLHDLYMGLAQEQATSVVFLGDSITLLWGDQQRAYLGSAAWARDFAPLGARNFGIFGDLTQNVLWRVEDGELAGHPRAVVLQVGLNNLMAGDSPQATVAGIDAVVAAIGRESPRTRILLLGLLPAHSAPADPLRVEVRQVNALLAAQRFRRNVQFLDVGSALLQSDGTLTPGVTIDTVHPSPEGYQRLAAAIDGPLLALLTGKPTVPR